MTLADRSLAVARRAVDGLVRFARAEGDVPLDQYSDPFTLDAWASLFSYQGQNYVGWPFAGGMSSRSPQELPQNTFESRIQLIYKRSGIVFAVMQARMGLFSEARFQWQELSGGRPGALFGNPALAPLEVPWKNGTTADLLSRMIQDADLAGNAFVARLAVRQPDGSMKVGLRRLRPDWVTIVIGSNSDPENPGWEADAEVVGYLYQPGGRANGQDFEVWGADEIAHWAPNPDPAFRFRGMSWLTPVMTDLLGDRAAADHKLKFFENSATPSFVVSLDASVGPAKFEEFVAKMDEKHKGVRNAYKMMYLAGGATPHTIGANFQQLDFKKTIGAGETRIASAGGVPPIIVGLSEGLEAATYSNYGQARRHFANVMRGLWRGAAGSLEVLVDKPRSNVRLWYDDRDIKYLQEDTKDAADIFLVEVQAVRQAIETGFEPDAVIDAALAFDLSKLKGKHTGLVSVQLQAPGTQFTPTPPSAPPVLPAPKPAPALPAPAPKRSVALTPREAIVVDRVRGGATNKEIAATMELSERTIERAVTTAMAKYGVETRGELAEAAADDLPTTPSAVEPSEATRAILALAASIGESARADRTIKVEALTRIEPGAIQVENVLPATTVNAPAGAQVPYRVTTKITQRDPDTKMVSETVAVHEPIGGPSGEPA